MSIRIEIIQKIIDINEKLIFYPKLKHFYIKIFNNEKNINIIDVGSNKGQSIDFFLKINKNATIFGFEPNKKLYSKLIFKYASFQNVFIENKGISNIEGKLVFNENVMDETSSFEELNFDSEYLKKKANILGVKVEEIILDSYKVDVTTLKQFIDSKPEYFFDVLKIDVEGHEFQALSGIFNNDNKTIKIKFIQIESHHDDMYKSVKNHNEINNLLNANGFKEIHRIKHGFGNFYEIIYKNNKY